jgi:hypothetical protein
LDERAPTASAMCGTHELNEPTRQIIPLFFDIVHLQRRRTFEDRFNDWTCQDGFIGRSTERLLLGSLGAKVDAPPLCPANKPIDRTTRRATARTAFLLRKANTPQCELAIWALHAPVMLLRLQ